MSDELANQLWRSLPQNMASAAAAGATRGEANSATKRHNRSDAVQAGKHEQAEGSRDPVVAGVVRSVRRSGRTIRPGSADSESAADSEFGIRGSQGRSCVAARAIDR